MQTLLLEVPVAIRTPIAVKATVIPISTLRVIAARGETSGIRRSCTKTKAMDLVTAKPPVIVVCFSIITFRAGDSMELLKLEKLITLGKVLTYLPG